MPAVCALTSLTVTALRRSVDGGDRWLLGGADLIIFLDGALAKPARTELLVLVLVAEEWQRRLWRRIVGDGARGIRCHWLEKIQIKLCICS